MPTNQFEVVKLNKIDGYFISCWLLTNKNHVLYNNNCKIDFASSKRCLTHQRQIVTNRGIILTNSGIVTNSGIILKTPSIREYEYFEIPYEP